jgi:enoyl-CoA hydratase
VPDSDEVVLLERREQVLLITLNRPAVRNAVNAAMAHAIAAALDDLDGDPELRVAIITGAPPGFCSGMDLKASLAGESPFIEGRGFAGIAQRGARKPLIAAVEGFAVAGGFEIALACDLIVAARGANFALPEVRRGLFAGGGALLRLPQRVPFNIAAELALTGEPIGAERLHHFGLVNRLADEGATVTVALELAAAIVAGSPLAVRTTKHILEHVGEWTPSEAWAEKRPPLWRSR